jgi:UDP-3-O-[3-hydroxymyristoyl] glucosamine N-acyltransferase
MGALVMSGTVTLEQLARELSGQLHGDPSIVISRVRALEVAGRGEVAVVTKPKFHARVNTFAAEALVLEAGVPFTRTNVIVVPNAQRAFVTLLQRFAQQKVARSGLHPTAIIDEHAAVGDDVFAGPGVVIERGARIGHRVHLGANSYVGRDVQIGDDCVVHANVTLYDDTRVGERVIIHSGTVIGSDGFGFIETAAGTREKIPQLGFVEIGDDVEIGANCAIDRATLEKTSIGRGTKIDNLVQIGHNVTIGEHCCIVGQAGIAGSVTMGNYVVLSGQVGISDHVTIGDRVILGAQTGVHSDLYSGIWLGTPAMPYDRAGRVFAAMQRLPDFRDRLRAVEDEMKRLEASVAARIQEQNELEPAAPVPAGRGNGSAYHTEPADKA